MARKTIELVTDDLDGSTADRTVTFAWNGSEYEIDLSEIHAAEFESALAPYLAAARRTSRLGKPSRAPRGSAGKELAPVAESGPSSVAVRAWAKEHGHDVPNRGRIS